MHLLFICSRNQWRSPTGEAMFKNSREHRAKSAGTENGARVKVTENMLRWADLIIVMEKKHRKRLEERFAEALEGKTLIVLDIPDDYAYMDEELVQMIGAGIEPYLEIK